MLRLRSATGGGIVFIRWLLSFGRPSLAFKPTHTRLKRKGPSASSGTRCYWERTTRKPLPELRNDGS